MPFEDQEFELRPEHIKLLRAAHVTWYEIEAGAPAIDGKRPYGNSDVARDVIDEVGERMGWERDEDNCTPRQWREQKEAAIRLHQEMNMALQVVLNTGTFESGTYVSDWYGREWKPKPTKEERSGDD
jgi:hypothetical protein